MSSPRNIIVVMTDQQRPDFMAGEGFPLDTMPRVDALATEGVRFRKAYTPVPLCLPARCSYLTGRFPRAHGVRIHTMAEPRYERDLVDLLNDAGYTTALVGKDHTYRQGALRGSCSPPATGYHFHMYGWYVDEMAHPDPALRARQEEYWRWMRGLAHGISEVPTPFPARLQQPVRVVDAAIELLEQMRREPFYLFLGIDPPHSPYQVPEPYFSLFPPGEIPPPAAGREVLEGRNFQWRFSRRLIEEYFPDPERLVPRYRANYCGMLRLIDDQVGRLLDFLDRSGLSESTVVLFTSDHSDYAGDYGLHRKGVGLPENLVRIPMVWRGPGIAPRPQPGMAHVSLVDVLPTLCGMLGLEPPPGVQGRDLWPLLSGAGDGAEFDSMYAEAGVEGRPYEAEDDPPLRGGSFTLKSVGTWNELNDVTQTGKWKMVVKGDWKLVVDPYGARELYDLKADPHELRNLANDPAHSGRRQELTEELVRWDLRLGDSLPGRPG